MIQFNLRYQLSFPIRFFGNEPVKLLIPVVALQSLMNKNIKHVNQMALLKNEMSQIHTYSCAYLCDSLQSHVRCHVNYMFIFHEIHGFNVIFTGKIHGIFGKNCLWFFRSNPRNLQSWKKKFSFYSYIYQYYCTYPVIL